VLKGFVVPLRCGTDASKTTASLQAQSEPRTAIRHTVPAIDRANAELQPVHIAFQLDLNLDVKRPSLLPDADPEIDVTRPIMEAGLN
jgi:hypothetical protein